MNEDYIPVRNIFQFMNVNAVTGSSLSIFTLMGDTLCFNMFFFHRGTSYGYNCHKKWGIHTKNNVHINGVQFGNRAIYLHHHDVQMNSSIKYISTCCTTTYDYNFRCQCSLDCVFTCVVHIC